MQVISQFRIGTASHALRRSGNSRYLLENAARRLDSTPESRATGFCLEATRTRPWLGSASPSHGRVRVASRQRSEEHTSELQSQSNIVCRLLLEKKKRK